MVATPPCQSAAGKLADCERKIPTPRPMARTASWRCAGKGSLQKRLRYHDCTSRASTARTKPPTTAVSHCVPVTPREIKQAVQHATHFRSGASKAQGDDVLVYWH